MWWLHAAAVIRSPLLAHRIRGAPVASAVAPKLDGQFGSRGDVLASLAAAAERAAEAEAGVARLSASLLAEEARVATLGADARAASEPSRLAMEAELAQHKATLAQSKGEFSSYYAAWLADGPALDGSGGLPPLPDVIQPPDGIAAGPLGGEASGSSVLPPSAGSEEAAKRAWLSRLDAPSWGTAAAVVAEASAAAAAEADLLAKCDAGVQQACSQRGVEEEAKRAWLQKLDAPTWQRSLRAARLADRAPDLSRGPAVGAPWLRRCRRSLRRWLRRAPTRRLPRRLQSRPERGLPPAPPAPVADASAARSAPQAWLSRLDAPEWGKAATALTRVAAWEVAGSAAAVAELAEACGSGDAAACDTLSREEEAKAAWLAKLDAPTWAAATAAVSAVASEVAAEPAMDAEEIAKAAWLAKFDTPSWGAAASQAAPPPLIAAVPPPASSASAALAASSSSSSAEAAAKAAWLARLEAPSWGAGTPAPAFPAAASPPQQPSAPLPPAAAAGSSVVASEADAAKAAWLGRLDAPSWGAAASPPPFAAPPPPPQQPPFPVAPVAPVEGGAGAWGSQASDGGESWRAAPPPSSGGHKVIDTPPPPSSGGRAPPPATWRGAPPATSLRDAATFGLAGAPMLVAAIVSVADRQLMQPMERLSCCHRTRRLGAAAHPHPRVSRSSSSSSPNTSSTWRSSSPSARGEASDTRTSVGGDTRASPPRLRPEPRRCSCRDQGASYYATGLQRRQLMRAVHVSHAGKGQGCRRGHQLARSSGPRRPHPAHTPRRRLARGGTPVTTSVPLAACRTQMQIRWWEER